MFLKIRSMALIALMLFSLNGRAADESAEVLRNYITQLSGATPTATASPVALAPETAKQLKEAQAALINREDKYADTFLEAGVTVVTLIKSGQMSAALAANNDNAQFLVGILLIAARKTNKDAEAKGIELLAKSAEAGNADAQALLASAYILGEGVPKDMAKAKQLFEKAAAQGHEKAKQALKAMPSK